MARSSEQKTARIRALNDALRRCGRGGRIMITTGLEALGPEQIARVLTGSPRSTTSVTITIPIGNMTAPSSASMASRCCSRSITSIGTSPFTPPIRAIRR